jgi:hypothetical protein
MGSELDYVTLKFQQGNGVVGIRELCGHDEQIVSGTGTLMAVRLLDRLLETGHEADSMTGASLKMTVADRDNLLAMIYLRTYGPRIKSTVRCGRCGALFDIDFSLKELQSHLADGEKQESFPRDSDGYFLLPDGRRFRLPTGEDELAVLGKTPDEATDVLLRRCISENRLQSSNEDVLTAMSEVAPLLDMELIGRCPECENEQSVHFDIQSYLLTALEQEKSRLAWEVHRLACSYGWSLAEILGLPRSIRRTYVALIETEFPSRRRFSL